MYYELWSIPGGTMVDDFDTEEAVLACVRHMLDGLTDDQADDLLILSLVRDDGSGEPVAMGHDLARLARATCTNHQSVLQ